MFQIVGVGDNGPPCAHQQQKPVKIQSKIPLVPPRPPTIIGGPLPCLGDERGPSANSGSLRFLDLGDAGGPCREPYGPLGAPMATQLVRYLQFFPARPFWDHRWNWTSMTMDISWCWFTKWGMFIMFEEKNFFSSSRSLANVAKVPSDSCGPLSK